MAGLLFLGDLLRDRDENINSQQANTVLIIACQVLEEGYHFIDNNGCLHLLHKLGQIVGCLSPHHWSLIVYQGTEVLSETLLQRCRSFPVWCTVQACGGDLGSEPIGLGEMENERDEVLFDLTL